MMAWRSIFMVRNKAQGLVHRRTLIKHPLHCLCHSIKAPNSYTSEDVVELYIHSGRAVIAAVLSSLADLSQGAFRLAEPGEFTRRAFESGRIDLTEAEGIRDLIDAETESQRKLAIRAAEVHGVSYLPLRVFLTNVSKVGGG